MPASDTVECMDCLLTRVKGDGSLSPARAMRKRMRKGCTNEGCANCRPRGRRPKGLAGYAR